MNSAQVHGIPLVPRGTGASKSGLDEFGEARHPILLRLDDPDQPQIAQQRRPQALLCARRRPRHQDGGFLGGENFRRGVVPAHGHHEICAADQCRQLGCIGNDLDVRLLCRRLFESLPLLDSHQRAENKNALCSAVHNFIQGAKIAVH